MKKFVAAVAVLSTVALGSSVSAHSESHIVGYLLRAEVESYEAAQALKVDPFDIEDNPYLYADMALAADAGAFVPDDSGSLALQEAIDAIHEQYGPQVNKILSSVSK